MERAKKIDKILGLLVLKARTQRKLSRKYVAEKMNLSAAAILGYETGLLSLYPNNLFNLLKAIDVNVIEFVHEFDKKIKQGSINTPPC